VRRVPIRLKLIGALAIPLVALLFVAAVEVRQSSRHEREVREETRLATSTMGPAGLITNLQNERNFGAAYLIGLEGAIELPATSFDEAQQATAGSIEAFLTEIGRTGGEAERAYRPVVEGLDGRLVPLRQQVDAYDGGRSLDNSAYADKVFQGYTAIINDLLATTTGVAIEIDDASLRQGAELIDYSTRQSDIMARLVRTLLLAGLSEGGLDTNVEMQEASGLHRELEINRSAIEALGRNDYEQTVRDIIDDPVTHRLGEVAAQSIESGAVDMNAVIDSVANRPDQGYSGLRTNVGDVLTDEADRLAHSAQTRERWFMILAALLVVAALATTFLVSRSITRPLRSLTRQAKAMAESRLPAAVKNILDTPPGENVVVPQIDPVVVKTRDEVADVSVALNTVQDSAVTLAVEQAVLRRNIADSFVSLGRRNQNLLSRQLDFITQLETTETDADALANLFQLDHLATRMRRNAESLLVLAGVDPPRTWRAPVNLIDILRAALGEVERYQRVSIRDVEPVDIAGAAAADLAHMLAELIENALTFSPPDQIIEIRGRSAAEGYTLVIIDGGLGMSEADIAQANRRLAGAESFTVAPSKYLGHYVAGHLAARHHIGITLHPSPGQGITAAIRLHDTVTHHTPDTPSPQWWDNLNTWGSALAPTPPLRPPAGRRQRHVLAPSEGSRRLPTPL
jgi:signal transduction histidine kinase